MRNQSNISKKQKSTKQLVNENTPLLEMTLHSKKINYERLYPIITQYIPVRHTDNDLDYDTVNIIIDLESIVKKLYQNNILEEIIHMKRKEIWQITSEIINIAAHYRHFFASRLRLYTDIYFYYSNDKSDYHTKIFPEYRNEFYFKRLADDKNIESHILNKALKENFNLIREFLNYVPHVTCIETHEVEPNLIPYILNKYGKKKKIMDTDCPTILLSNEEIYFQDLALFPNMLQLLTKGEKSRIITRENMWEELTHRLKKSVDVNLMPEMYTLVLASIGYKDYSIDGCNRMAIGRGIPFVEKNFNMEITSLEFLNEIFQSNQNISDDDKEKIKRNFTLLSHEAQDKLAYNKSFISDIKTRVDTNYINADEVMKINEKYFQRFPILIDYLFEGEEY